MATLSTSIQAITNNALLPKLQDAILKGNVLAAKFMGSPKPWMGRNVEVAVKWRKTTTGKSFFGTDTFDFAVSDNRIKMAFDPRAYGDTVTLAGTDVDTVAADKNAAVNLVTQEFEGHKDDMVDSIGTILYSDGTGNSNKEFLGLRALIDDGTYATTIGGLSRTTYGSPLKSYCATVTGNITSTVPILTAMAAARANTDKISFMVTSDTKFNELSLLAQSISRQDIGVTQSGTMSRFGFVDGVSGLTSYLGFDSIFINGTPVTADQKCNSLELYGINDKYLEWRSLPSKVPNYTSATVGGNKEIEGVYGSKMGIGLSWSGWEFVQSQYAFAGKLIIAGNMIVTNPTRHFRLTYTA